MSGYFAVAAASSVVSLYPLVEVEDRYHTLRLVSIEAPQHEGRVRDSQQHKYSIVVHWPNGTTETTDYNLPPLCGLSKDDLIQMLNNLALNILRKASCVVARETVDCCRERMLEPTNPLWCICCGCFCWCFCEDDFRGAKHPGLTEDDKARIDRVATIFLERMTPRPPVRASVLSAGDSISKKN